MKEMCLHYKNNWLLHTQLRTLKWKMGKLLNFIRESILWDLLKINQRPHYNSQSFQILVLLLINISHKVHFPIAVMVFCSKTVLLIIIRKALIKTQVIYFQFLMLVVVERVKIRKTLICCLNKNFLNWLQIRNLKKWKIAWDYKNNNYKIVC